jgi:hypothetical protein
MANKQQEQIVPDFLNHSWEHLFRRIGNDGVLTCQIKCLALVLILYVPGLVITALTGTLTRFLSIGWGFFLSNVLIGIIVWLLIDFLKEVNDKLVQVNQILTPLEGEVKQEELENVMKWEDRKEKYKQWTHKSRLYLWYYFYAFGASISSFFVCEFVVLERIGIGWVQNNPFNELYFITWFIALGFIGGACLHYIFLSFWIIRRYCKDVISTDEIRPFDPDHTGGLRELGRLALDLDLVVALPSLAFLIYLPQNPGVLAIDVLIGISILYCLFLISVFFISLSPAHDSMINAKVRYLMKIHEEYRERHLELLNKLYTNEHLDSKDFSWLRGLYKLYDRVESMAVWPLDYRTLLRFLLTSILPLIASVITVSLWP